jgi:AcrR family transcriptional regulator
MSPKRALKAAAEQLRPRVEGDREQEIFAATIETLRTVGYDRLTMDAVAAAAKASKATLYRRWNGKADLVIDALSSLKPPFPAEPPDTGTLRGDLIEAFCGVGGLADGHQTTILGSVVTAISRDPEFAEAFRRDFVGPKIAANRVIFERARDRGELRDDVDIELLAPALPGITLHRTFILGDQPSRELITRIIDQVILPAATRS